MNLCQVLTENIQKRQLYLAAFGLFYLSKVSLGTVLDFKAFIGTYILPKIVKNNADFVTKYGKWAIVTGCTQGIGQAYVYELAERGMNIVLISRNKEELEKLAKEIKLRYTGSSEKNFLRK